MVPDQGIGTARSVNPVDPRYDTRSYSFSGEAAMSKYLVEFIGTFFLFLTIGCCIVPPGDAGALAPLAIGSVLMVMIFAGGYISGAHYNPAVSLAVFLRGRLPLADLIPYMLAQVL